MLRVNHDYCFLTCLGPSYCWPSDLAPAASETLCYGDSGLCFDNCTTLETQEVNATCLELNYCGEMLDQESEKTHDCSSSCRTAQALKSRVRALVFVSGTFGLNFYREAIVSTFRCSPTPGRSASQQAAGRIFLYGSLLGAVFCIITITNKMRSLSKFGITDDSASTGLVLHHYSVIFLDAVTILCACAGRLILAASTDVAEAHAVDADATDSDHAETNAGQVDHGEPIKEQVDE